MNKKCGDLVVQCVPEKFHHFFAVFRQGDQIDNEWWGVEIDGDEDSIGVHVSSLLLKVVDLLALMPDVSEDFTESIWKAAGDQCLTWVHG